MLNFLIDQLGLRQYGDIGGEGGAQTCFHVRYLELRQHLHYAYFYVRQIGITAARSEELEEVAIAHDHVAVGEEIGAELERAYNRYVPACKLGLGALVRFAEKAPRAVVDHHRIGLPQRFELGGDGEQKHRLIGIEAVGRDSKELLILRV